MAIGNLTTEQQLISFVEQRLNLPPNLQGNLAYLLSGIRAGTGSPEGVVTAAVGTIYRRLDGGAGTSVYFKESGAGNTGWSAK